MPITLKNNRKHQLESMLMNTFSHFLPKREFVHTYPQYISFGILILASVISLLLSPLFESFAHEQQFLLLAISIGIIAGLMSYLCHLPTWWQRINSLFAVTIFLFYRLELPPWSYLLAFVILLAIYWNTLMTRVPYYPSNLEVWQVVEKWIPQTQSPRILEIGSGLGGFSRYISKRYPQAYCVGLETAPLPWLLSYLFSKIERAPCIFKRKNYIQEDFSQYDLIYAFLSPAAMQELYEKAKVELNDHAKIMSYMFSWPAQELSIQKVDLLQGEQLFIYSKQPSL
jgi:hypothetical protein